MNFALKLFASVKESFKGDSLPRSLSHLADNRIPVRLEVENSESSFYTVLSIRPKGVVLGKPPDLQPDLLKAEAFVRFTVPDGSRNVIRMKILKPGIKRKRGDSVILCEYPEEFAAKSMRKSDRFNTSRYKNLQLYIPQLDARLRIVDISRTGCKVLAEQLEEWDEFQIGRLLRFGKVVVSDKAVFELGALTPRHVDPPVVSFQWEIADDDSARYLEHLIKSLHSAELNRLKVSEKRKGAKKPAARRSVAKRPTAEWLGAK